MAKQLGLGKGLGALLDEYYDEEPAKNAQNSSAENVSGANDAGTNSVKTVAISALKPNPYQPREEFTQEALSELADSIREHGIIQPPTVEACGDGTYYIIAGERRTRAAQLAGLKEIPVILQTFSDEEKLEIALIENIQRENLNPIEEARAYMRIMQLKNISQEEVAKRVGKNRSTVANALRLLKLPEDMQSAVYNGTITAGHARALLSVLNPSDQRILFARIVGTGMSVRDAESSATELNGGARASARPKEKVPSKKNADIAFLEEQFLEVLGTKTTIKGTLDKGVVQIEFYSKEDLDRLYNLFTGNK